MNEDALIKTLCSAVPHRAEWLKAGIGDDCALLDAPGRWYNVLKVDAMVQDVHFTLDMPPQQVGRKALARVLSDFSAMGAEPQVWMVSVGIPRKLDTTYVKKCYQGMNTLALRHRLVLAGGETTQSRELWLSMTGFGRVLKKNAVRRSTAWTDDVIFVTGKLGGSFPERHLRFQPRLQEGQWLAQNRFASAMMDLSDGLGKDLPRLAKASNVSFAVEPESISVHKECSLDEAVNDGEDYELLFTVRPNKVASLLAQWPFRTKLTRIGRILPASRKPATGGVSFRGHEHFTS